MSNTIHLVDMCLECWSDSAETSQRLCKFIAHFRA